MADERGLQVGAVWSGSRTSIPSIWTRCWIRCASGDRSRPPTCMIPGSETGPRCGTGPRGRSPWRRCSWRAKVTTAHRPNFTRMYDLSERVIPDEHFGAQGLEREEAQSILLLKAARSMGVATAADLADYHRIRMPEARPLIERLSEEGELVEVEVEGWGRTAYLHPEARLPRKVEGRALLSPFDNLVWYPGSDRAALGLSLPDRDLRPGAEAGLRLLRAPVPPRRRPGGTRRPQGRPQDRGTPGQGRLRRAGVDRARVGRELRAELETVASWLGLRDVRVGRNGDLAEASGSLIRVHDRLRLLEHRPEDSAGPVVVEAHEEQPTAGTFTDHLVG